jgi:hypothetical protein
MSNQLAMQFNWFGKKGKRAFGKLKLAKAVQSCCFSFRKLQRAKHMKVYHHVLTSA